MRIERTGAAVTYWRIYRRAMTGEKDLAGEIAVGLRYEPTGHASALVPAVDGTKSAPFHLFFPTKIPSGLPFLLHGYFQVDASRKGFHGAAAQSNDRILTELAGLVRDVVRQTSLDDGVDAAPDIPALPPRFGTTRHDAQARPTGRRWPHGCGHPHGCGQGWPHESGQGGRTNAARPRISYPDTTTPSPPSSQQRHEAPPAATTPPEHWQTRRNRLLADCGICDDQGWDDYVSRVHEGRRNARPTAHPLDRHPPVHRPRPRRPRARLAGRPGDRRLTPGSYRPDHPQPCATGRSRPVVGPRHRRRRQQRGFR